VLLMTVAGYVFGNVPLVKSNFGLVTIAIVLLSLLPLAWAVWRERSATS
jgi:membrane-associated protein